MEIAGHAGLFSTANDISKLIAVLMNKGELIKNNLSGKAL